MKVFLGEDGELMILKEMLDMGSEMVCKSVVTKLWEVHTLMTPESKRVCAKSAHQPTFLS